MPETLRFVSAGYTPTEVEHAGRKFRRYLINWAGEGTDFYLQSLLPAGQTDILYTADDSGASGLCVDRDGRLYVATRLGVQVCDQAGRVNAILPTPNGRVSRRARLRRCVCRPLPSRPPVLWRPARDARRFGHGISQ
jgi:hypothetical protein